MRCSGFSTDQLQQIVGALPAELPWRRWIALLGLFTGAGLNEICGLATDDAAEQDGVPVLLIRPDTGRGLKTPNARRVISVHPTLIRCGFLAYVAERRAAGESRLFPLDRDSRGRFADRYQKWFSRFLERVGAKAPKTSYHSFRHSFTDALRRAGATGEIIDGVLGWSRGNVRDRYGSGAWIKMLADVIQEVEYGLDLGHLHVQ
jgi:integrase